MSLMICSTSHRQKGVRQSVLVQLVAGAVLAVFYYTSLEPFCCCCCLFLHFMVYSVETVTEAF